MVQDPLKQPRSELVAAAKAIDGMRNAKTLEDFEAEWRAYLNCVEKLWLKVERCCQHVRGAFEPWQGT